MTISTTVPAGGGSSAPVTSQAVTDALGFTPASVGAVAGKLDSAHGGSGGTAHANVVAGGAAGFMAGADKTKLDGIAAGATANATDAQLRDRATHTGTQAAATITGLAAIATSGSASDLGTGTLPAARLPAAPDITDPKLLGTIYTRQPAQTTKAAAATLTIAELLTRIIQYTGAAANLTMPTGTLIDAGVLAGLAVDRAFEFTVVNTGTGTATIVTATGLTLVGSMAVALGTSATFRVRKSAANTFTVIRL